MIGRAIELAACSTALSDLTEGRGRLLVLSGEAGIGKTTVARAAADMAAGAGVVVRWGTCWEQGANPFDVWREALRRPGGGSCAPVAEVLGGVAETSGDEASDVRGRQQLFERVVDALRADSTAAPQLVVLEDLHWADRGSLDLLLALAPRLPTMAVTVVASWRTDEMAASERFLGLGGSAWHVPVQPLDVDAVAELVADILGRTLDVDAIGRIHARTGGNPLFATELARLAAAGSSPALPAGVGEVLGRRLARLGGECHRVLGAASAVGLEFDAAVVAAATEQRPEAVEELLSEAAAARLVERDRDAPGRWRFAHDLVRAARYDALGPSELADLHRRIGAVLEQAGASSILLVHHAARARPDPTDERLGRLAVAAGREALGRFAWEDAEAFCRQAEEWAPAGSSGDPLRAEACLCRGDALLRSGGDAASAFLEAAEVGRRLDAPELVARAALGFGAGLVGFEVQLLDRRQVDLLEEAAGLLPADASMRPVVLARLSVASSFLDSPVRRLELADEAIELARRAGDATALVAGLAARCDALAGPDHVQERASMASEIIALGQRTGSPQAELLGRRLRVVALMEQRKLASFDAEVSRYAQVAEQLGDDFYSWWAPLWTAARCHADGRFAEASELRERARAMGASAGSQNADLLCLVGEAFQAIDTADGAELERVWAGLIERHPGLFEQEVAIVAVQAIAAARFGDAARCRSALAVLGPDDVETLAGDQEWLTIIAQFLEAAVFVDDTALVKRCYDLLVPYAGLGVCEGAAAVDRGPVERFLALGAAHLENFEAAARYADAALTGARDSGRWVWEQTHADIVRIPSMTDSTGRGDRAPAYAPWRDGAEASLRRDGDVWAIEFGGAAVRVKHAKGIADLAVLLGRPGQDVHVRSLEGLDDLALPGAVDPALDRTAVEQYRARLRDLEADLDEADNCGDLGWIDKLTVERDVLVEQLTQAFGLAGRTRPAGSDPDDRLRKAVSARVKASIDRVEELHPALGRHLRNAVHTGFRCRYDPEPPVRWTIDTRRSV